MSETNILGKVEDLNHRIKPGNVARVSTMLQVHIQVFMSDAKIFFFLSIVNMQKCDNKIEKHFDSTILKNIKV